MFSFQSLLSKIQVASTIDFGDLFNESVTLFKKVWVQGLILQLFSILIMLPFIIIFYVPYFELILENSSNGVMDSAVLGQELIDAYGSSLLWIYSLMLLASLFSCVLYLGFQNFYYISCFKACIRCQVSKPGGPVVASL